jgi:hypothetical protein
LIGRGRKSLLRSGLGFGEGVGRMGWYRPTVLRGGPGVVGWLPDWKCIGLISVDIKFLVPCTLD